MVPAFKFVFILIAVLLLTLLPALMWGEGCPALRLHGQASRRTSAANPTSIHPDVGNATSLQIRLDLHSLAPFT